MQMSDVLGDGDNVMVGVRLSTGEELSAVVYIDHNVGTLVNDAFVVGQSIDDLLSFMQEKVGDHPDTSFANLSAADAKKRIVDAIHRASITIPPFETETWPACRALVEWMIRFLPDGGQGYERPEWSEAERRKVRERFFASPFAADLDDPDHRSLLNSMVWFGCDYGPGDPMRWSPVAVEILLVDWIPRKLVDDVEYLTMAPEVLRAFVRFCHAERGIAAHLTAETLDALDRWEPGYQASIRSPRLQGPAALLAAVGTFDEALDFTALRMKSLEAEVGGRKALARHSQGARQAGRRTSAGRGLRLDGHRV